MRAIFISLHFQMCTQMTRRLEIQIASLAVLAIFYLVLSRQVILDFRLVRTRITVTQIVGDLRSFRILLGTIMFFEVTTHISQINLITYNERIVVCRTQVWKTVGPRLCCCPESLRQLQSTYVIQALTQMKCNQIICY